MKDKSGSYVCHCMMYSHGRYVIDMGEEPDSIREFRFDCKHFILTISHHPNPHNLGMRYESRISLSETADSLILTKSCAFIPFNLLDSS